MKKLITLLMIMILVVSCDQTPGESGNVDMGNNPKYNLEYYQYGESSNDYVIIVTRKDSLEVTNISYPQQSGKQTYVKSVAIDENRPIKYLNDTLMAYSKKQVIMENDSIVIIRK